ncbi:MAG: hypothetical protein K2J93_05465, partial [Anaeroplasmataceae bacterium]|nr:hypothetical protein [Anaeroplasmataceae bacterium]
LLYTVTTTMIENGLPAFEDIVELPYGSTKEITILPRTGYNLVNVIVDDVSLGPIPSYTLEDIKEPHTIQVEVEQEYFRIVVTSTEGGTVNPLGNAVVMYGADKFFTFIPDTGYYVKNVRLDNRQDLGQISSYIFERVVNDHSLHIEFEQYTYTITHNTPEHGRIEADGDLTVPYGSDRTMTFTPDEGFVIADVKINGISVGALSGYTFLNIQENQDVVVEFEQIFFNIDVQISGNGSMNPNESLTVPYGTNQTFVITPEQGYYISRLEIDGRVTQIVEEYVFEHIVANHTISVEFEKLVYNIDVDIEGQGNVDIADNLVVDYGTDLVIHITPDYGQRIQLIELDENGISVANVIELANVTQNHHIRIVFEQIRYTLTIEQIGNGSINPSSSSIVVNYGDEQTFSFLPDRGNGVKDVKVDEESLGSISTYRLEDIQANHTIRVEFEELFHTITVTSNGHGTVTPEGEKEYAHDSNLACRFEPDEGYYISDIIVDGNSVGNEITGYYFAAITEDHTIEVQFSAILFSMIVSFGPHGTITYSTEEGPMVPNDVINVAYGSTIDFTITPDANYIPKIWINNEVTDSVTELSIENIQRNYLIQVDFTQLVRIDITHEGNGVVPESNEYVIYTPLTLVFTPDPGNKVKEILIDGLTVGSVDNYTFPTLISSHTVNVIFEQIIYSVHSTIHGEGTVVGNKNLNQLFYADSCVVTITPEEGWSLGIVFVDGEQTEVVNNQITIKNIDDDVEIVVYFSEIPVRAIPMWIFILLGVIILILIILLILVSIFNKKRKDRYRY